MRCIAIGLRLIAADLFICCIAVYGLPLLLRRLAAANIASTIITPEIHHAGILITPGLCSTSL